MLKASDMILVNYEGVPIGGEKYIPTMLLTLSFAQTFAPGNMRRPANAAGFLIHSAVHRAREDVIAACHTHSVHGMAWSAFGRPIEMITQDAAYLYGDAQAVYRVCLTPSVAFNLTLMINRTLGVSFSHRRKAIESALL